MQLERTLLDVASRSVRLRRSCRTISAMHRAALLLLVSLRASDAYPAAASVEVVIAHYDEDLAWLRNETGCLNSSVRLHVYHKKPMTDRIRQSLAHESLRKHEKAQPQVRRHPSHFIIHARCMNATAVPGVHDAFGA